MKSKKKKTEERKLTTAITGLLGWIATQLASTPPMRREASTWKWKKERKEKERERERVGVAERFFDGHRSMVRCANELLLSLVGLCFLFLNRKRDPIVSLR